MIIGYGHKKSSPGLYSVDCQSSYVFLQVAQTVTELLSSPRAQQPKIDANLILDNFLSDLKQSITNR